MKKTLLTIFCAMTALFGMAQTEVDYTEQYVVTVNGTTDAPKDGEQTIVNNSDGTVNFVLHNLNVEVMGQSLSVEKVTLKNLTATVGTDGLVSFKGEDKFTIPADKLNSTLQMAVSMGMANFTDIPVTIDGKFNAEKLYAQMDIKLTKPAMTINVEIGTDNFPKPAVTKIYTERLLVTINGETSEPQMTDLTVVDNGDGTINFVLRNFFLGAGEETMPVGNIAIENIPVTEGKDGLKYFSYNDNLAIQPGDDESVEWVGPMFGPIPLNLNGKMNDEKLYVTIDIDLEAFGQTVHVELGTDDFVTPEPVGTVYTEQLLVTVNGESNEPQEASITVYDNGDGTINFVLKNFFLGAGEDTMPVGNIFVENIPVEEGTDGLQHFAYDGTIVIQPGDIEGVEWYGPMLGPIPVVLKGKMNDEKLYVIIDINLEAFGQIVNVQLGTDDFPMPVIKNFTEPYYVTVMHEQSSVRTANIEIIENDDATINFTIKDLVLEGGELTIPVGDLTLHYLQTEEGADGMTHFSGERSISIPADKLPADSQELQAAAMMGAFNDIPTTITGKYNDNKFYADIKAEKAVFGYTVTLRVQIGVEKGDVNCDSKVDIADAVSVLNAMAGETVAGVADVNGDKHVDIADFVSVLNMMAGQ